MLCESPVAVILPFFNCDKQIEKTSNEIIKILKKLVDKNLIPESSYLLLVDCNSEDESWFEAGKVVARNPNMARAIKLTVEVKTSVIMKKAAFGKNIVVDFKNYNKLEEYIFKSKKSTIIDKLHPVKDLLKSSEYVVLEQLP